MDQAAACDWQLSFKFLHTPSCHANATLTLKPACRWLKDEGIPKRLPLPGVFRFQTMLLPLQTFYSTRRVHSEIQGNASIYSNMPENVLL